MKHPAWRAPASRAGRERRSACFSRNAVEGRGPNKTTGCVALPAREAFDCAAEKSAAPLRTLDCAQVT